MKATTYRVTLVGESPLLLHADHVEWAERMSRWQAEPENRKISKAGDDRTPAWRWLGYCYHDGKHLGVSADNLMTMLREGGARVPVPGKRNQTFKRQSQSGLIVNELLWPIVIGNSVVAWKDCAALMESQDYNEHEESVRKLGFELFAKRAKVGQSKHIRVRPRFDRWAISGTITVFDETISATVLRDILAMGGTYCGLGDWRPSAPSKPGAFGKFRAEIEVLS